MSPTKDERHDDRERSREVEGVDEQVPFDVPKDEEVVEDSPGVVRQEGQYDEGKNEEDSGQEGET